ncbi:maleylpyruvate isomerase N-terminal domain-containing protein [Actinacidiphila yanglinensis]|uniref:maleylpyruvate isomerase N-terminal domain-containing protein n=1 Tax=Actinacidiphila yanglinensis TaxID=310779 RepID=UPI00190EF256
MPAQREQHGSSDDLPPVPGAGAGSSAGSAAGAAEAAPVRLDPPEPPTPPDPLRRIDPGASSAVTSDRVPPYDHGTLKSLLGAWALAACSRDETLAVEVHLTDCAGCADEALRLRDAVGLLHHEESLDLDPLLRARVLEGCLGRRPARIPVPEWAGPYDAEAARLDALLRDLGDGYWTAPVRLQWFDGAPVSREFTVGQVIAHLIAVDGLVGRALGLPQQSIEPPAEDATDRLGLAPMRPVRLGETTEEVELPRTPVARTAAHWAVHRHLPGATLRLLWREQSHRLVRTVAFAGEGVAGLPVDYGDFELAFHDAFVDRAFECWTHATDIAEAVDYPYEKPALGHMRQIVGLAADKLPGALAARRRAGLTTSASRLVAAGSPGRSLLLEIEGDGGGEWWLPLDSPGAMASPDHQVAHVAMDSVEFCQLTAGHVVPERAAAGKNGDRAAIRDVLYAAASLSRL